jgi:hypothetical protein
VPHNNQSGVKIKEQSRKHPPSPAHLRWAAMAGQAKYGKHEKLLTTYLHLLTLKTKERSKGRRVKEESVGLFNIPALREFNPALQD